MKCRTFDIFGKLNREGKDQRVLVSGLIAWDVCVHESDTHCTEQLSAHLQVMKPFRLTAALLHDIHSG